MTEMIFICFTILSLVLVTHSQGQWRQAQVVNPDIIYFNRDDYATDYSRTPSLDLQPPHRPNVAPLSLRKESENNVVSLKENRSGGKPLLQFDATSAALTNFSLNLMKNILEQRSGNTVVSPYSISSLLSLLQQGTADEALRQISTALGLSSQASADAYRTHNQDFENRHTRNILRTANNIFLANAFSVNPNFSAKAQTDFASDVTHIGFSNAAKAADVINSWVSAKTDNKIDKILNPDAISENTQMVMVNAIYFKGIWEIPFRPQSTRPGTFVTGKGLSKTVPFMSTTKTFKAGIDRELGTKVIVLPFELQEYSLMLILPSTLINVHDTFKLLSVDKLETYLNNGPMDVHLELPKFSIRADTDLSIVFKKMGITKIFQQPSDLSGIGTLRNFAPQVTSAVHSAILSIDEEGGSAAAATAFNVVALSNDGPSMVMRVDRPFIAVLWDGRNKLPLFTAIIDDPSV